MEGEILSVITQYEGSEPARFLLTSDKYLNQIDVVIEKEETLTALRQMKNIRYVEPADYHYFEIENQYNLASKSSGSGSSGCGFSSTALNTADYTSTTRVQKFRGLLPNTIFPMPGATVPEQASPSVL